MYKFFLNHACFLLCSCNMNPLSIAVVPFVRIVLFFYFKGESESQLGLALVCGHIMCEVQSFGYSN